MLLVSVILATQESLALRSPSKIQKESRVLLLLLISVISDSIIKLEFVCAIHIGESIALSLLAVFR